MSEIKCPNCGASFKVDDGAWSKILLQVRTQEFEKEVKQQVDNEVSKVTSRYEEEIATLKEFKQKLNVKQYGESLEQYCQDEFRTYQNNGAFPNATFEKDNTTVEGSKGDFIFRDFDESGTEIVSIMFDMKNENDSSRYKQKNDQFFAKLDSDRKKKSCEYAVLVSVLEPNSDFYNTGIVDVSKFGYSKMYVVRPQFFMSIISILSNAARQSLADRKELKKFQEQNAEIAKFDEYLNDAKRSIIDSIELSQSNYEDTIENIDKAIALLEEIKTKLSTSLGHNQAAKNKANSLSSKRR